MNWIIKFLMNNWSEVAIGFSIPIILDLFRIVFKRIFSIVAKNRNHFLLDGTWVSKHISVDKTAIIEFVRIKYHKNNKCTVKIKQYRESNQIKTYSGNGIKVDNYLFLLYESDTKADVRGGTLTLERKNDLNDNDYLQGIYVEYNSERQKLDKMNQANEYCLYSLNNRSIATELFNAYRINKIRNYNEADNYAKPFLPQ